MGQTETIFWAILGVVKFQALVDLGEVGQLQNFFSPDQIYHFSATKKILAALGLKTRRRRWVLGGGGFLGIPPLQTLIPISLDFGAKRPGKKRGFSHVLYYKNKQKYCHLNR